jgi:hypothetical protein
MKYCEVEFKDEYSICIKAERKPNKKEAFNFLKTDCDKFGYMKADIKSINEIDSYEAHTFFDMDKEDQFPIFA